MITLTGVSKNFGAHRALQAIEMQIAEGESVAFVGESGSGKTTLGRVLLGLMRPTTGQYLFEGQDVFSLGGEALRAWRRQVQPVFQNPSLALNPRLRIDRLITEPVEVFEGLTRRELPSKAVELLDLVGLPPELAQRYPHQLSGGQRQRVAIARAVSVRPRFLVLDEPVSALDVSIRSQTLNLLSDLRARFGMTIAYITHDLATVQHMCERAYVLYRGTVMEELSAQDLSARPDNPYTRTLLASVLTVGRKAILPTADWVDDVMPAGGCPFTGRCPERAPVCERDLPPLSPLWGAWRSRCCFAGLHRTPTLVSARDREPASPDA